MLRDPLFDGLAAEPDVAATDADGGEIPATHQRIHKRRGDAKQPGNVISDQQPRPAGAISGRVCVGVADRLKRPAGCG
jgi:hypothetical protein